MCRGIGGLGNWLKLGLRRRSNSRSVFQPNFPPFLYFFEQLRIINTFTKERVASASASAKTRTRSGVKLAQAPFPSLRPAPLTFSPPNSRPSLQKGPPSRTGRQIRALHYEMGSHFVMMEGRLSGNRTVGPPVRRSTSRRIRSRHPCQNPAEPA